MLELLFFFGLGVVVSLDVAALTAVRANTYTGDFWASLGWAIQNAFWHAILLLGYGAAAFGVIDIAIPNFYQWLVELLRSISAPSWIVSLIISIGEHGPFIFAIFTITWVWRTYRSKILDNPLDGNVQEHWQSRFVMWLLNLAPFLPRQFVHSQGQAIVVAVDMLAIAFLLKGLNALQSVQDVWVISQIIFVSVTVTTLAVCYGCKFAFGELLDETVQQKSDGERLTYFLFLLKLIEPLLVFFFVVELMSFVIWGRLESSPLFFLASGLLVFALLRDVTMRGIIDVAKTMKNMLLEKQHGSD